MSIDTSFFKTNHHGLHPSLKVNLADFRYWNLSYSYYGEDLILKGMVKAKLKSGEPGFYVDLGCAFPLLGSNTMLFYRYGWRGLCVDANEKFKAEFELVRPNDTFVNCAVGDGSTVYWAQQPKNLGMSRIEASPDKFSANYVNPIQLTTVPLRDLLEKHVPPGTVIDLMSVDLEDSELTALKSNDWDKFRPHHIAVEVQNMEADNFEGFPVIQFLRSVGYRVIWVANGTAYLNAI